MEQDYEKQILQIKSKIKSYPDFPKKGIVFWDIFSAISDGPTCKLLNSVLEKYARSKFPGIEAIVGLDARGFIFGFALAAALGVGFFPVRKKGKLPGKVYSHKYDLEYGSDTLEIQKDFFKPGLKCLVIDDLLATGGSMKAAIDLLKSCQADIRGCIVIMELISLNGRKNIPIDVTLHSLIKYD